MSIIGLYLLVTFASPAFATDEPRKVDFTTAILDQDDKPITECADNPPPKEDRECISRRPITLGVVALSALVVFEQGLKPEDAIKRGALGMELYKATAAVLTPEDIVLLKQQITKRYNPFITLRAVQLIDPTVSRQPK